MAVEEATSSWCSVSQNLERGAEATVFLFTVSTEGRSFSTALALGNISMQSFTKELKEEDGMRQEEISSWNKFIIPLKTNVSIFKLPFLVPNVIILETGVLDY